MNAEKYIEMLDEYLEDVIGDRECIFIQDNAAIPGGEHLAEIFLRANCVHVQKFQNNYSKTLINFLTILFSHIPRRIQHHPCTRNTTIVTASQFQTCKKTVFLAIAPYRVVFSKNVFSKN